MSSELRQLNEKLLKQESFRKELEKEDLAFEIAESIIDARIDKGVTQEELAKMIGTKQPAIARIENGNDLPSLNQLQKITKALGYKLKVKIQDPLAAKYNTAANFYIHLFQVPDVQKTETKTITNDNVINKKIERINNISIIKKI
ncbi:MAG: helix-turn-helix transcriptional regulator [Patescibacteria group bacterium]|nr:helix-turn-helix transcriptional regulator [Patescibacteria group bacterium]